MKSPMTLTLLALLSPATAAAAPLVWWQVPEYRIDNVHGHEIERAYEERRVLDQEFVIERRKEQIADDKEAIQAARQARRHARREVREARRATRTAQREDLALYPFVEIQEDAERDLLEAHDNVDLAKTVKQARRERLQLDRARRSLAKAELELEESQMLQREGARGWRLHQTDRYRSQVERISQRTDAKQADWQLAMVDVGEAHQDLYHEPYIVEVVKYKYIDRPEDEAVADAKDEPMGTDAGEGPYDLRRVYFDLDSDELDTEALNAIAWNSWVLRNNRKVMIEVEGHTDKTGPNAYNRELAWDRARAVEEALLDNGVWPSQIELSSVGEADPILATNEPLRANRRTELNVVSDPDGLVYSTDPTDEDAVDREMITDLAPEDDAPAR